jgi:hypothetical protein
MSQQVRNSRTAKPRVENRHGAGEGDGGGDGKRGAPPEVRSEGAGGNDPQFYQADGECRGRGPASPVRPEGRWVYTPIGREAKRQFRLSAPLLASAKFRPPEAGLVQVRLNRSYADTRG